METKLSDYDNRLLDIHSGMYPFVHYGTTGKTWYIKSSDYDEEFKSYMEFISFVEEEVKYALLNYAINKELGEIAEL